MAQFDVFENLNAATAADIPYLLDIQNELLDALATRVVVPLVHLTAMPKPARHLNPVVTVAGEKYVMSTAELAGVPHSTLGPKVTSLEEQRLEVIAAIDFLISGI